jgi:hypothetical protein
MTGQPQHVGVNESTFTVKEETDKRFVLLKRQGQELTLIVLLSHGFFTVSQLFICCSDFQISESRCIFSVVLRS